MLQHPFFTKYFPNAVKSLIKPDQNANYKPFIICKDNPKTWEPVSTEPSPTPAPNPNPTPNPKPSSRGASPKKVSKSPEKAKSPKKEAILLPNIYILFLF